MPVVMLERAAGVGRGCTHKEETMNDSAQHAELPLPDFDDMAVGDLASRNTALDERGVIQLLSYEHEHGNRLPVTQVLEHRLEALRNGAEPGGS
jgi:hypothetical protein